MFVSTLSEPQKRTFITLAREFAHTDRHLSEVEESLLEALAAEAGLSAKLPQEEVDLAVFDSRRAKAAVILELIGIGQADSDYGPEENAFVRQLAARFDISDVELLAMENWVLRQIALTREAEKFWSD